MNPPDAASTWIGISFPVSFSCSSRICEIASTGLWRNVSVDSTNENRTAVHS